MSYACAQTDLEWTETYGTYSDDSSAGNYTKMHQPDHYQSYPESVDWRTKGAVTSIKDQVATRNNTYACKGKVRFKGKYIFQGQLQFNSDTIMARLLLMVIHVLSL